jgi:hypothetical protein
MIFGPPLNSSKTFVGVYYYYYDEDCLCTEQSLVAGAPGPWREPATFTTAGIGPNHYPSWEVVAEMRELTSRSIWRILRHKYLLLFG